MKTIILCGGVGTRLREETEFKPKPMVKVGGMPLIWHIMKIYASYGYNEFILALGYKADYIKDYFLNQKTFSENDFKINFVDTGEETLIGERILKCKAYIPDKDKHFMVTYGDGVADINIADMVNFYKKQKTLGIITGVHPKSKFGLLHLKNENLVSEVTEKPKLIDWVCGGFMIFDKKFFKYLRKDEMEHPALNRIAKMGQLSVYKHNGFWYAVDTFKELEELNKLWNLGKPKWKVWNE